MARVPTYIPLLRGDAGAAVADAERCPRAIVKLNRHGAPVGAVTEGVVEQDPEDPGDAPGIAERPHRSVAVVEHGHDVALGATKVELREHGPAQLSQLDGL